MAASCHMDVEIKSVSAKKGKGLFAKRKFQEGDVILSEAPIISCQFLWNELYKYEACEFCQKSLETAEGMSRRLTANPDVVLPHPECCTADREAIVVCPQCRVQYCSQACREVAWQQYHKVMCLGSSVEDPNHPVNRLKEIWRNIHYPPESACIMLLAKMVAMVKQTDDKGALLGLFSNFVQVTKNEEEEAVHKLLGKQFQDQLELLRHQFTEAFYDESVQKWFTPDGFRSMFALMGTNQQGVGSSSISSWVKNCDKLVLPEAERTELDAVIDQLYVDLEKESGTFLNCEGVGLYRLQSACNHSCCPNAEITFLDGNHTLSLEALQDIEPEEEICISYLDECALNRSRHSRQKDLRENYLFNCDCPKCHAQIDDPDVTSEEEEEEDEEMEDQ